MNDTNNRQNEICDGTNKSLILQNSKKALQKLTVVLLLIAAVFGHIISYGKLYAFHLVLAAYWGFILTGVIAIKKKTVKTLAIPLLFLFFMSVSLLWSPNLINGLKYLFYFLCGYTIIFAIINYADNLTKLNLLFKTSAVFFLLNFFVGLLETTGNFRLPISQYYGIFLTKPSGFYSNLNNFGFVFIATFPFIFFYQKRLVSVLGMFLALWFTFKLESKGFFLGLLAFFAFYVFSYFKQKSSLRKLFFSSVAALFILSFLSLDFSHIEINNRAFTAFAQIDRGLKLLTSNVINANDSTGVRAAMYLIGMKELISSYGGGLGVAGIGSKLASQTDFFKTDSGFFSFHNFFLEMLVDLGFVPFFIVMYAYFKLAFANIKAASKIKDGKLAFYNKASGFALLTIIPASISPSSIIYEFTFWMIIGFAMATHLVTKVVDNNL